MSEQKERLSFEYLVSEFARPDFKLPKEEDSKKEFEWAMIRTLFAGSRLIDAEKVNTDKKGNKPMDEELFQRVEVNIEKFTRAAMELQAAVIYAEAQLKDAKQQWIEAEKVLEAARQRWADVEKELEETRGQLRHHLDSVRGMKVTMVLSPGWEQGLGERDE